MEFRYKALNKTQKVSGHIAAKTKEEASEQLRAKGYQIVDIKKITSFRSLFQITRRISAERASILFSQLALMTDGGIDIVTALELIEKRTKGTEQKKIQEITASLRQGKLLSTSVKETEYFPSFVFGMLKSGEAAGRVSDIFKQMATYFKEEHEMQKKMINALAYPMILLLTSIIVLQIVLQTVLPIFVDVFKNQSVALPFTTRLLISLASHFDRYGIFYLGILLCIVLLIIFLRHSEKTKLAFEKVCYHMLLLKPFLKDPFELRQLKTMKMQMDNGVDILNICHHAKVGEGNAYIASRIEKVIEGLMKGESLSQSFRESHLFKEAHCAFIEMGEASSALSEMLEIAIQLEESRQKNRAERMTVYIEPVLILLMALVVGFIIFSIAIPMFDMVNYV